jgi:hypothetical protein
VSFSFSFEGYSLNNARGLRLVWTSVFYKNQYQEHQTIALFQYIIPLRWHVSDVAVARYRCRKHIKMKHDIASSGRRDLDLHRSSVSVLPTPSVVQRSENHWRLSLDCKDHGSWFSSPRWLKSLSWNLPNAATRVTFSTIIFCDSSPKIKWQLSQERL